MKKAGKMKMESGGYIKLEAMKKFILNYFIQFYLKR